MIRNSTNFMQPPLLSLPFSFQQFCFSALVRNGIVPKPDAERLLGQAV